MSLDVYLEIEVDTGGMEKRKIQLFEANITHNLTGMAAKACIYKTLWHPEGMGVTKAGDIIDSLVLGLADMRSRPEYFKQFNPENGWGDYEGFVQWIQIYLDACERDPEATIVTST